jgi:hypothetical protein
VTGLQIEAGFVTPGAEEVVRYPSDEILLRVIDRGDIQVVEYPSTDREGPPAPSRPWDEVEVVLEGEVEFDLGGRATRGGPGTVQLLPRKVVDSADPARARAAAAARAVSLPVAPT